MKNIILRRFLLTILCLTAINCSFTITAFSQSTIGGLTLGVALSKLGNDLKVAVDQAREAGRSSAMEAGMQVNYAMQNFAAIYNFQMNQTVNLLDKKTRGQLGEIERMINDLKGNDNKIKNILSQLQILVSLLPFREHQPQLGSVAPTFVVPSSKSIPIQIDIKGNFEFASRQGFEPVLRINNKSFKPIQITNQTLSFSVPSVAFVDIKPAQNVNRFGITTAELIVPWTESKWMGLREERHQETYRLLIGKLPEVPGSITIESVIETTITEQTTIVRGDFGLRSDRHGGNIDHSRDYEIKPNPGCQLVPGTAEFFVTSQGGTWNRDLIRSDVSGAVYRVNTYHPTDPRKAAGHVDFRLKATQSCSSTIQHKSIVEWNTTGHGDLRWGEQKTFPLQNVVSYKIKFLAFDGKQYEFITAGDGGNLLRVDVVGQGIQIRAADSRNLQWP